MWTSSSSTTSSLVVNPCCNHCTIIQNCSQKIHSEIPYMQPWVPLQRRLSFKDTQFSWDSNCIWIFAVHFLSSAVSQMQRRETAVSVQFNIIGQVWCTEFRWVPSFKQTSLQSCYCRRCSYLEGRDGTLAQPECAAALQWIQFFSWAWVGQWDACDDVNCLYGTGVVAPKDATPLKSSQYLWPVWQQQRKIPDKMSLNCSIWLHHI